MSRLPTRRRSVGFSLIEAMVAMAIFMVGVTGFMVTMVTARGSTAWARRDMEASAIAQDLAGQIESWDYNDPRLTPNTTGLCDTDPTDSGQLLTAAKPSATAYGSCAHQEADLGVAFQGRADYRVPVGASQGSTTINNTDDFTRMWIVHEEDALGGPITVVNDPKSVRKRIWVLIAYRDGVAFRRIVTYQTKVQRGNLR